MFKINIPLDKNITTLEKGFVVSGAVASTEVDYENDAIAYEALEMVADKLKGVPLIKDHNPTVDNTVGIVEDAWIEGNKLMANLRISDTETKLKKKIEEGIIRSLSIGGAVNDYDFVGGVRKLTDIEIKEISLTPVPANPDANIYSILKKSMDSLESKGDIENPSKEDGDTMTEDKLEKEMKEDAVVDEASEAEVKEDKEVLEDNSQETPESEEDSKEIKDENAEVTETKTEDMEKSDDDSEEDLKEIAKSLQQLKDEISELKKVRNDLSGRLSLVKMRENRSTFLDFLKGF